MKNLTDFFKTVGTGVDRRLECYSDPPSRNLRVVKLGLMLYVSTFCHLFSPGLRPVSQPRVIPHTQERITMSKRTICRKSKPNRSQPRSQVLSRVGENPGIA